MSARHLGKLRPKSREELDEYNVVIAVSFSLLLHLFATSAERSVGVSYVY